MLVSVRVLVPLLQAHPAEEMAMMRYILLINLRYYVRVI